MDEWNEQNSTERKWADMKWNEWKTYWMQKIMNERTNDWTETKTAGFLMAIFLASAPPLLETALFEAAPIKPWGGILDGNGNDQWLVRGWSNLILEFGYRRPWQRRRVTLPWQYRQDGFESGTRANRCKPQPHWPPVEYLHDTIIAVAFGHLQDRPRGGGTDGRTERQRDI